MKPSSDVKNDSVSNMDGRVSVVVLVVVVVVVVGKGDVVDGILLGAVECVVCAVTLFGFDAADVDAGGGFVIGRRVGNRVVGSENEFVIQ